MKEVKAAQRQQEQLFEEIEAQVAFYDDALRFGEGGETTEQKTVHFMRDELYQEIWEISLSKTAKKHDVPYDKLKAACMKADIPLPTQSYWGNLQCGKTVSKTPLPESDVKEVTVTFSYRTKLPDLSELLEEKAGEENQQASDQHVNRKAENLVVESAQDKLGFLTGDEQKRVIRAAAELSVSPEIKKMHPVLQRHKAAFHTWAKEHPRDPYANWNRDTYRSKPKDEPPLWECVSEDTLPRVYRILDPLYRAIESLGGRINDDFSIMIRGERVYLSITEGRDQSPHVLTKSEQKQLDDYERDK